MHRSVWRTANPVFRPHLLMWHRTAVPHDFPKLHEQLEAALSRLKATGDPVLRRHLLVEIRLLLLSSDEALASNVLSGSSPKRTRSECQAFVRPASERWHGRRNRGEPIPRPFRPRQPWSNARIAPQREQNKNPQGRQAAPNSRAGPKGGQKSCVSEASLTHSYAQATALRKREIGAR